MSISINHKYKVAYGLLIGTDIASVTLSDLNGVIALILCYFTEFDSFGGRLCHEPDSG